MTAEWATATSHFDQVNPGEWETYVTWNDGEHDRRVLFRPLREGEIRCDLMGGSGDRCCLLTDHEGPHVAVAGSDMPFVIAP